MNQDLLYFFLGIGFLILYLIWSALTEMGTKPVKTRKEKGKSKN